jgi:hypothetical protein
LATVSQPSPLRTSAVLRQRIAYAGLLTFTVLLYLRPNEWLPIGTFPIVKIISLLTLAALFLEQISEGRPFSVMPREFKYLLGLALCMVLSIPMGLSPGDSFAGFTNDFLKVLLIFMLMINVTTSLARLRRLLRVTVLCGTFIALGSIGGFAGGANLADGFRATGIVGGIFGNPNDLALALNLLLPIAIALLLSGQGPGGKVLFASCAVALALGVLVTYSRAGVVTLGVLGIVLLWHLHRRYPLLLPIAAGALVLLVLVAPGSFWTRIFTVFDASGDASAAESSEIRWALLQRSIEVAGFNPIRWILGVGVDNFHFVSVHEKVHHNSYAQVFNEVGLPALVLYVMFLFGLIRTTGRIARAFAGVHGRRHVWLVAVALQTSLIAYAVGSMFASTAYIWYLYYIAGFAVCLKMLVLASIRKAQQTEVPRRVWNLRRLQY